MSRVLIVEDDPNVVELLTVLLAEDGYDVEVAGDGLAGLLKLGTIGVDAIVLDLAMPDVDGARVLEQLCEEHGGRLPVPVLVVTGWPDALQRVARWVAADDVFIKPFDPAALLARLRTHLEPGGSRP